MIFPHDPLQVPRHPSQIYESMLEGLVLFCLLNALERWTPIRRRPGALSGVFLMGYAVARMISELFREPDSFLGFLAFGTTMGQLLSIPLFAVGLFLLLRARPATQRA
jgi:phosphatidylglycerol:prolipoprotein diacylglycerol transferase